MLRSTALLQPMHSSARGIRGEILNRLDSTADCHRSLPVGPVFIPSAISSLPLGDHCAPIAVPAERDDNGIWQVYYNGIVTLTHHKLRQPQDIGSKTTSEYSIW